MRGEQCFSFGERKKHRLTIHGLKPGRGYRLRTLMDLPTFPSLMRDFPEASPSSSPSPQSHKGERVVVEVFVKRTEAIGLSVKSGEVIGLNI